MTQRLRSEINKVQGARVEPKRYPEQATRVTAAGFVLESIGEVQRFLDTLT